MSFTLRYNSIEDMPPELRARIKSEPEKKDPPPEVKIPEPKGKRREIEHQIQKAFFNWIELHKSKFPILAGFFAIPNGGSRGKSEAGKLKAEGVRPGIPDVFNFESNARFKGLWIEFKTPGKEPRADQWAKMKQLRRAGYMAEWFDDWTKAANYTVDFYNLPESIKPGRE